MASYFCTPDSEVVHALAGPVSKERFLQEARWAVETWTKARDKAGSDRDVLVAEIRKAHEARSKESCQAVSRLYRLSERGVPAVQGCWSQAAPVPPAVTTLEWLPRAAATTAPECRPAVLQAARLEPQAVSPAMTPARSQVILTLGIGSRDLHPLLAEKGLPRLDEVYGHVFQNVLGERISDEPVRVQEMLAMRTVRQVLQVTEPDAALRKEVEELRRQVAELKARLESKSKVY